MGRVTRTPEPSARRDEDLAARWAEALQAGSSIEDLEAQILTEQVATAAAGVRALGNAAGTDAIPLLSRLGHADSALIAEAACDALGAIRSGNAADALQEIATAGTSRIVQKAARRATYRLSSQGIRSATRAAVVKPSVGAKSGTLYRAVASTYDGSGSRALWLGVERPLGGIYMIAMTINDRRGLTECSGIDTTRKRFAEREAEMREHDRLPWIELPVEYARQLVQEAIETAREGGYLVPPTSAVWTELIGEPSEPFQQALVYKEISAIEVRLHPTLENETPRLFEQPELDAWFFRPVEVQKWAKQLADTGVSRLLVTPETDEQRADRLIREAARELLTKPERRALRRRLEETAYVFLRTDRLADARRAVAAAATIEEERPLRPPHPFLRVLIARSFEIATDLAEARRPARRLTTV